jgi:hypothetical protein
VYLLKSIEICDTDFGGRETNNWTILLVERVDVEYPLASDNRTLKTKMCEACVPGSGKVSCGTSKADVDELSM